MAKPFGKIPKKWLELPSTQKFLEALLNTRKSGNSILWYTKRGRHGGGTWFNEDVALEYAR
jgi:hypothetical protein